MTYGELLNQTPLEQRTVYVYMWFYKTPKGDIPFYVGIGTKNRYRNKSNRSRVFREFISNHDCYPIKCAINLNYEYAREVEKMLKVKLKEQMIDICDAEDCEAERRKRIEDGINAMPIVNGKRVSTKTGNSIGREKIDTPNFQKFLKKQQDGKITVDECCKTLGISRKTWYNRVAEVS